MSKITLVLSFGVAAMLALLVWLGMSSGLISLPSAAPDNVQQEEVETPALTLQWTDLIPPGYNPDDLYVEAQRQYNIDELQDDDPLVVEVMKKM